MVEFQMVWGWEPALYLFLGGTGAGALIASALLAFIDRSRHQKTIAYSLWASAACMIVGLLLLLAELVHPLRGMLLWQSFVNPASWMTWGAWGVLFAVIVAIIVALLMTPATAKILGNPKGAFSINGRGVSILLIVGALLGLFVAAYTGILLMSAPGVPLWGTMLLPVLFTISALGTGIALVELISYFLSKREKMSKACRKFFEKSTVVLVVAEACVLAAFLFVMTSGNGAVEGSATFAALEVSLEAITTGFLAPYFWCLVVLCGLLLPVVASTICLRMEGKDVSLIILSGAIGTLIGGCALRFVIMYAGTHADLVADAVALVIA